MDEDGKENREDPQLQGDFAFCGIKGLGGRTE